MAKRASIFIRWKACLCLLFLIGLTQSNFAQFEQSRSYANGFAVGIHSTSRGAALEFEYSSGTQSRLYLFGLSLSQVKDLREVRIDSFFGDQGRSYVFGKLNHFVVLQPSFGLQHTFLPKSSLNIVKLSGGLKVGPSIGLLSPYFLEIYLPNSNPGNRTRDIVPYNPAEHSYGTIYGRASLISSRIELTPTVGFGIKPYLLIDFGREVQNISALKLGASLDAFFNPISIMQERDDLQNRSLFLSVSAGLLFGKRW